MSAEGCRTSAATAPDRPVDARFLDMWRRRGEPLKERSVLGEAM